MPESNNNKKNNNLPPNKPSKNERGFPINEGARLRPPVPRPPKKEE